MKQLAFAVSVLGLMSCGGGAKLSKDSAASVTAAAGGIRDAAGGYSALAGGAFTGTLTSDCPAGGKVTLSLVTASGSGATVGLEYQGCTIKDWDNPDTKNIVEKGTLTYNGKLTDTYSTSTQLTGGTATTTLSSALKGRIELTGDVSDFVDADVTIKRVLSIGKGTADISVTASGDIKTSTQTFDYDNYAAAYSFSWSKV